MTTVPKSSNIITKRLQKDLIECNTNAIDVIYDDKDFTKWTCILLGPSETDYEGGVFKLAFSFPPTYPMTAPSVKFLNSVYHPNVSTNGTICVDILKDKWSPVLSVYKVLVSIQSLLNEPNPDSPLNGDAARLYKQDRRGYRQMCQKYIRENP